MFFPEQWLLSVAVKKASYGIAKALLALVTAAKAASIEQKLGIHIDPSAFEAGAAAMVVAGVTMVHDWAKLKFPNAKWL